MDVVYQVGPGDRNEELRFALRSLAHLPHDRVWIVGHCPSWTVNVGYIPVAQGSDKWENSVANIRAACLRPEVAEELVISDDDMFVMAPVQTMPVLHRGPLAEAKQLRRRGNPTAYSRAMHRTAQLLERLGRRDLVSYETHVPMPIDKSRMGEALALADGIPAVQKRTLYGNVWAIGGAEIRDVKVMSGAHREPWRDWPFVSTTDHVFATDAIGRFIRERFPDPSPYEE